MKVDKKAGITTPSQDMRIKAGRQQNCGIENRLERGIHNPKIGGSIPPVATNSLFFRNLLILKKINNFDSYTLVVDVSHSQPIQGTFPTTVTKL